MKNRLVEELQRLYRVYPEALQLRGFTGVPGRTPMNPVYQLLVPEDGGWAILCYSPEVGYRLMSLANENAGFSIVRTRRSFMAKNGEKRVRVPRSLVAALRDAVPFPRLGASYGWIEDGVVTAQIQAQRLKAGEPPREYGLPYFAMMGLNGWEFPRPLYDLSPQTFWDLRSMGKLEPIDDMIADCPHPVLSVSSSLGEPYMVLDAPENYAAADGGPRLLPQIPYCCWDQRYKQLRLAGTPYRIDGDSTALKYGIDLRPIYQRNRALEIADYDRHRRALQALRSA